MHTIAQIADTLKKAIGDAELTYSTRKTEDKKEFEVMEFPSKRYDAGVQVFQSPTQMLAEEHECKLKFEFVAKAVCNLLARYPDAAELKVMANAYEENRAKYFGGSINYVNNSAAFIDSMRKAQEAQVKYLLPDYRRVPMKKIALDQPLKKSPTK